jgi:hypothetical protein
MYLYGTIIRENYVEPGILKGFLKKHLKLLIMKNISIGAE